MLQLTDIRKSYTTADFTQVALDDISISFRDNEFVAILGPSGSGKTTLLNIVGGLDHYDSGNLIIDGISTEQYLDRDWDAYRNNRIGFVFQSYNLIPHQTVLANVELALTLSGVSRAERRDRATKALEEVGLGDHINKKPSQLSGGQMQRVAIARALINDPEILLADEPTGALDSKTSVQIMALLTEIAKDRLVIMVTHNPDLADEYANRIVNLNDGKVTADSNPFNPSEKDMHESSKPVRKTVMSFLTAISLSFNNLMTKKGRTLMTAFAGSIGIIGIAAILALANGVNNYIKGVEEDTLSDYPVSIQETGFDMTSMMVGMMGSRAEAEEASSEGTVSETKILADMFSSFDSNDLGAFKEYLDSGTTDIDKYTNLIEYSYDITPQIYSGDTTNGVKQINPDNSFRSLGLGSSTSSNSMVSSSMSTNLFIEYSPELLDSSWDVVTGRWPERYDEVVLSLDANGGISDFTLYVMGLRDQSELDDMTKQLANNEDIVAPEDLRTFTYDELLDTSFKVVNAYETYQYDPEFNVYRDKSDDTEYMKTLIANGLDLKVVGIVQAGEDAMSGSTWAGFLYTPDLTEYLMDEAADAEVVLKQKENPAVNVFTGVSFADEEDSSEGNFDLSKLITVDGNAISSAFTFDTSKLNMSGLNLSGAGMQNVVAPEMDISAILAGINVNITAADSYAIMSAVMNDYFTWCVNNGNLNPNDPTNFDTYFAANEAVVMGIIASNIDIQGVETQVQTALSAYMGSVMETYMKVMMSGIESQLVTAMNNLSANMAGAMGINEEQFASAFQFNMTEQELSELMMSFMYTEENSYKNNLKKLGYADPNEPSEIDIYPIDFESKAHVIAIIDDYNARMEVEDEERVISYTDIVGSLMSSVTDIVNMVSYVLVAFVAISLVVSSIMIGVITYISVLERKKEIGILRSIGASKKDIGHVFNAETLIVGFVAGFLGIMVTVLLTIPINAFVEAAFNVPNVALLPWEAAVVLIVISMLLTFLAGLIPSSAASRKDPVEALRSE